MKKFILLVLSFLLIPMNISFPQDNVYGDYLMSGTQKLISLDLEGAKLVDTLKMLSQQTGLNFISTEAVKERTLTLYLEKVPLKEAMDIIFKANNLSYEYYPDANMFVVKEMGKPAIELKTKVYHLNYVRINSTRQQKEITSVMEGTTTISSGNGMGSSSSSSSSSSSTSGDDDKKEIGIKNSVKKVLTEFGKISEDPITNSLIVIDVPVQFAIIDEVIANLDIPMPKIMIEVELLDVTKGLIDQIGFKYGQDGQYANDFVASYSGSARSVAFPLAKTFAPGTAPAFTYGKLAMGNFQMLIQALSTDTTTKILARPKILTLSNETAEINLTTNEAIGINTTTTETGVQTSTTERTETGTKLRVTPQVGKNGDVTLFLEVFTKDATDSELTLTGDVQGTIKNPEERGARTVLRLANGETLLLGGLIRNKTIKSTSKIPFLGDIPLVGKLFSYKDDNKSERELLVFMTPKIIEDTPKLAASGKPLMREQDYSRREVMNMVMDRYNRE